MHALHAQLDPRVGHDEHSGATMTPSSAGTIRAGRQRRGAKRRGGQACEETRDQRAEREPSDVRRDGEQVACCFRAARPGRRARPCPVPEAIPRTIQTARGPTNSAVKPWANRNVSSADHRQAERGQHDGPPSNLVQQVPEEEQRGHHPKRVGREDDRRENRLRDRTRGCRAGVERRRQRRPQHRDGEPQRDQHGPCGVTSREWLRAVNDDGIEPVLGQRPPTFSGRSGSLTLGAAYWRISSGAVLCFTAPASLRER